MNSSLVKVLLIDRDPERRKERISVLKKHGYKVFPALDLQEAKVRCKPDAYDLIVVNSGGQPEMALELCEWIKRNDSKQAVLLMEGAVVQLPRRDYMVSDIPERLLERIESMFERADVAAKAA
jgi:DNA-binding response OmpR family regulator